jgi:DHA1 family tetracycline resistance protein-like MFS transporter
MAVTVFVDMAAFAIAVPMLPFWAQRFGADATVVGLLLAAYAIAQLLFTPLVGTLSDRVGRRPVIVATLLLEAGGLVGTAVAGSVPALLAARFVGGIGGSSIGSAQAVVADVTDEGDRTRAMGIVGAAIGLGFVVGPSVGAVLALVGPAVPFWAAAAVAIVNAAFVAARLPETGRPSRGPIDAARLPRRSAVLRLLAVMLLYATAFGGAEAVLPLLTQRSLGWGAPQNGLAFALVALVMVAVEGGFLGRLRRAGVALERRFLLVGLTALGIGLVGLAALAADLPPIVAFAALLPALAAIGLGVGLANPVGSAMLARLAPPEGRGRTLGLGRSASSLGRVVGPAAAGILFARVAPGAPFLAGAALVLVGTALLRMPVTEPSTGVRDQTGSTSHPRRPEATAHDEAASAVG